MSRDFGTAVAAAALVAAFAGWSDDSASALRTEQEAKPAKIAFLRLTSGFWQVWMMNGDGSLARQLTTSPVDKVHVAWRPGTQEILYHTNQGDSFLLDLATRAERRLLENLKVTDAAWRPDGQRLAFGLPPDDLARGKTSLWEAGLDGQDRRRLSGDAQSDALAPSWLDGETVVFRQCVMTNNMETRHDFWLLSLNEAASARVVQGDDEKLKFDQTVSREGVLAYSSLRSGSYEVWTLPVSGGESRQVTRMGAYAGNPTWSPGGGELAFDSDKSGSLQIYRVRAGGGDPTRITNDPSPSRKPVWGPVAAADAATNVKLEPTQTGTATASRDAKTPRPATPSPDALSVSWVSTDRLVIDTTKNEQVVLRYQLSSPATVTARFIDSMNRVARTITVEVAKAGDQRITWDGRGDTGQPVPADAYVYTISARDGRGQEVTYDLRPQTAGEPVWARDNAYDPVSGRISYTLPQASRVRLFIVRRETMEPVRSLLDWAVRGPGVQQEAWDGWSEGHAFRVTDAGQIITVAYGYSLPRNAVIVEGTASSAPQLRPASTAPPFEPLPNRVVQPHALHSRARCYNPRITLSLAGEEQQTGGVIPFISEATPVRIDFPMQQGEGRLPPQPRMSIFVFMDGQMVERCLSAYAPYQWIVDPNKLRPGEHVITALIVWRDDHLGLGQARVKTG